MYGPNGYYHNFIQREPSREYYNVYGNPCNGGNGGNGGGFGQNCADLRRRDRQKEYRNTAGARGVGFVPALRPQRPAYFAGRGKRDTFSGL